MNDNLFWWAAIDRLAADKKLSCSRLAQISGLDVTAFNKSKRVDANGRPHWPSLKSLVKVLIATETSWTDFARYFPPQR